MSQPRKKKNEYIIPAFDGGLNTTKETVWMESNESPGLQNIAFEDQGSLSTSPGARKYFDGSLSNIHGFGIYKKNKTFFCAANGTVYRFDISGAGSWKSFATGYDSSLPVRFIEVNSVLVVLQKGVQPKCYDGVSNNASVYGQVAPTSTIITSTESTTDGNLYGTYKYALTYVNKRGTESDYTIISDPITVTHKNLDLSGIPVPSDTTDTPKKRLYRASINENGLYYLVDEIDSSDTTYTDEKEDTSLITEAPVDNGVLRDVSILESFKGVSFASGGDEHPDYIYWSRSDNQEIFPAENYMRVGGGDNIAITAVKRLGSTIVIHRNDYSGYEDVYILYVGDSVGVGNIDSWYLSQATTEHAAISQDAVAYYSNVMFYAGKTGAYALSGQGIVRVAADSNIGKYASDRLSANIKKTYELVNKGDTIYAIEHNNKIYMAFTDNTATRKVLVYDYVTAADQSNISGAWSIATYEAYGFVKKDDDLYYINNSGDLFYITDGLYTIDGLNYDKSYKVAPVFGADAHVDNYKIFRHLIVWYECVPSSKLDIIVMVDEDQTTRKVYTIDLECSDSSLWGTMIWGTDTWGSSSGGPARKRITLGHMVGRRLNIEFNQRSFRGSHFKVYRTLIDYNLKSIRR